MGSTSWFIQSGAAKTAIAGAKRRLQRCVNYRLGPNPTAFGGVAPSHDLSDRVMMLKPLVLAAGIALVTSTAGAQDVPGVEVCTAERSMVRRTSCLQSTVDFLQKLFSKNASDRAVTVPASWCSYGPGKLAQNILRLFPDVDRGHVAARTKDHTEDQQRKASFLVYLLGR
jgi:hypothetical protein